MSQTYDEKINEFIDWVTGKNKLNNDDVTGGLPVSGGRIRELLQERAISPVYLYENRQKGKYQLFSSQKSQEAYAAGGHDELLLGEFDGPAAYKMIGRLVSDDHVYLTNNAQGEQLVTFRWACLNAVDGTFQPTYSTVTITIVNNGIKIWEFNDGINSSSHPTEDTNYQYEYSVNILPHLQPGINSVTVIVKSDVYSASVQFTPSYDLVEFKLNENLFDPFLPVSDTVVKVQPEYTISVDSACYLNVFVDEVAAVQQQVASKDMVNVALRDIQPGVHILTMYLSTQIQGIEFRSNVICKQFVKSLIDIEDTTARLTAILNFSNNDSTAIDNYKRGIYNLILQQYSKFTMRWGLYNVNSNNPPYSMVRFYVSDSDQELVNEELIAEFPNVNVNTESDAVLEYLPKNIYANKYLGYVIGNGRFRLIAQVQSNRFIYASYIAEADTYIFKYDAFGKNNTSDNAWNPIKGTADVSLDGVTCTPVGIEFTNTNGWYQSSFRTKGIGKYILLNNLPFSAATVRSNFTFEIDFMTEYISSNDDLLVNIGNFIKIYPNRAILLDENDNVIIQTNFKTGERAQISFIKYPELNNSQWSNIFLVVTNGIMERATNISTTVHSPSNQIKIGDSASGIRVYNMRYYGQNLDWRACYNNWIFDSDNKADIVTRNMVFFTEGSTLLNEVDEAKCIGIMDTILIEGDLLQLVNKGEKLGMKVDSISRICPTDATKNFKIKNCWLRTHGQSNIEYPVPSFKFWSNKEIQEGSEVIKPELILEKIEQEYCKGRMQVYDGAVPANKWVLQSNFADSSGSHNATFLKKWQDLCYAAKFNVNGKEEFKLRTPPQLFTSGETITPYDNGESSDTLLAHGYNTAHKQWKDYTSNPFPYTLRQAPNSFPTLLFFRATDSDPWTFFGQYVFMDDKKSDYEYGERSIYQGFGDDTDPFVLKRKNIPESDKNPDGQRTRGADKYDKERYRVWDNENVVRIEVLDVNEPEVNFQTIPQGCAQNPYWIEPWDNARENRVANKSFELIYPDVDDLKDDEVADYYGRWISFCTWVVSTKNNPQKFQDEAAAHLDLYKIAAYYIWYLMFGLVDSVNRNAQWKTYDGVHWWIEPWDMDIALGRNNNGDIAYDPPIDRQTSGASPDIGAFSGKGSVLWNHLEAWSDWMTTIVPSVAQALYTAGLKYDTIVNVLDKEYSERWPEYIYNKSGEYKYIYSGLKNVVLGEGEHVVMPTYLAWLQGASLMHRHWWLSTSMDYWFSKFGRGAFVNNTINIKTDIPGDLGTTVRILPSQKSFFAYYFQQGSFPASNVIRQGYDNNGLTLVEYIINTSFSSKKPFYICGASNMEELDISDLGSGLIGVNPNSEMELKVLKLGSHYQNGTIDFVNMNKVIFEDFSKFTNLQTIDVTGHYALQLFTIPSTVTRFYAAASNFISGFTANGNIFEVLHLPNTHYDYREGVNSMSTLQSLILKDCSWNELKFFDTTNVRDPETTTIVDPEDPENNTERKLYTGTIAEATTQLAIKRIELLGKTCQGINANNSRDLVIKWIEGDYAQSLTSSKKIENLKLENIDWHDVTLAQLRELAEFYDKVSPNLRGKITLAESENVNETILAEIQNMFGDGVFTLGSVGIVVDYPIETAVISVGSPAQYDVENNQYLVDEVDVNGNQNGINMKISYVRFNLQPSSQNVRWRLLSPGQYEGDWIDSDSVLNHNNVSIVTVVDEETEMVSYYLRIKESDSRTVTEPYVFRLGVYGQNAFVEFKVTPVTHILNVNVDDVRSTDVGIVGGNLLIRTDNSVGYVDATIGGTSTISPRIVWSLSGAATNFLTMEETASGIKLSPSNPVTDDEVLGTLRCEAYFSSCTKSVTLNIKIKLDRLIITENQASLLHTLQTALGTQSTSLYESDIAHLTQLELNGIYNYNTELGIPIFAALKGCTELTLTACGTLSNTELQYFTNQYIPSLRILTIQRMQSALLDITNSGIQTLTTIQSNAGVKAKGNVNLTLDSPSQLDLQNVNGRLIVTSPNSITNLKIDNDSLLNYSGWISLIPATNILTNLYLDNVKACSVSNDQHELQALITNSSVTISSLNALGTISVPGYYKYYADSLDSRIYNACNFNDDYYVLYNVQQDETYSLYTAFNAWLLSSGKSQTPNHGHISLGWTSKALKYYATTSTGYTSDFKITLSGITEVQFNIKKNKNTTIVENLLNDYLTGYNQIDLRSTTVDPKINVRILGLRLFLGSPITVTIKGDAYNNDCRVTLEQTSQITSVDIAHINNVFSTVLGWGIAQSGSGTISGTEAITSSTEHIVTVELPKLTGNPNITLTGTINATDVVFLKQSVKDALVARFTYLTLNVSVAMAAVDAKLDEAFGYVGIRNINDLRRYTWKTFWNAVYDAMPASETKNTDFTNLCNQVVYAPEACYMSAQKTGGERPLDLALQITGLAEPHFSNLKLLCYAVPGFNSSKGTMGLGHSNNNNAPRDLPSGCYPLLFSTSKSTLDGVFMIHGGLLIAKWNSWLTSNYVMFVNGTYGVQDTTSSHKWVAYQTKSDSSNFPGAQTTASEAIRTGFKNEQNAEDWPMALYNMMSHNITGKTLIDWFNGSYDYDKNDFIQSN